MKAASWLVAGFPFRVFFSEEQFEEFPHANMKVEKLKHL